MVAMAIRRSCCSKLIDFYNLLHHLERSTPRQTLPFTSPPKSRKFVRPPSTLRRQSSTYVNQPCSPTLFPCPLKKPPSCWNLLRTSTVRWTPYQLWYWRSLLTALLHSLQPFAIIPTHPGCPISETCLGISPTQENYDGPLNLNSYRPNSNLSLASKVVEHSFATRFVLRCHQNHLLPVRQSAFRRHHSTETAALIVHNDIRRAIDKGQLTVMMFLDLSSAFDAVD